MAESGVSVYRLTAVDIEVIAHAFASLDELDALFSHEAPRPLGRVELGSDAQAALQSANQTLGLALSEDEVEYLAEAFAGLGRDPTDVELMMFAQAN